MILEDIFHFFVKSAVLCAILLCIVAVLLYIYQNNILYMPVIQGCPKSPAENQQGMRSPADMGLAYENVTITTEDQVKLRGWFVKQTQSQNCPTVVYFHENAGNIGTRIYYMREYVQRAHVNLLLVAYRGYSDSEGSPSEEGLQKDGLAILQFILSRTDIDNRKVFLHGRSLGGAVSVYCASTNNQNTRLAGVILENTFTSIPDMVDSIFKKISFLKSLVLKNFWPSIDRIDNIQAPILFIQSMKDELVPPVQMTRLFEAAKLTKLKQLHVIPDGDHNGSWTKDTDAYFRDIGIFMQKCCELKEK